MGWVVWILETALALLAAYAVAVAIARDRGTIERGLVTILVSSATVLTSLYACALAHQLARVPLGIVAAALHGALLALALRRCGRAAFVATLRHDLSAPWRWLKDVHAQRELAAWAVPAALAALAVSALMIWFFRSWTWDCVWYHVPMTSYAIQTGSLDWIPSHVRYLNGYPRNLELLAVWGCIFPMHNRLDDLPQLQFALLGGLAVAGFVRRAGGSAALSGAAGAMWIATPAVYLQIHSTHVDTTCGALLVTGMFFATAPRFGRVERWMTALALGLYAGTKFTGVFHLLLLAPLLLVRVALEIRDARGRRALTMVDLAASVAVLVWIGGVAYFRNALHTGNPMWPFRMAVPLLGGQLPGVMEQREIFEFPSAFWGDDGAFWNMLHNWYNPRSFWAPDVRTAGFGVLFQVLALPCLLAVTLDGLRGRDRRNTLPVAALALVSIVVPGAWWARFTLGLPAAAIIAWALVRTRCRWGVGQVVLSGLGAFLALYTFAQGTPGYITFPKFFRQAVTAGETTAASLHLDTFLWAERDARRRETTLRRGDVVAYDDSVVFLAELWTHDYRNRVEYAPYARDDATYLRALRRLHPRWVVVGAGSPAEAALSRHPGSFRFLFPCPVSPAVVWDVRDYRW